MVGDFISFVGHTIGVTGVDYAEKSTLVSKYQATRWKQRTVASKAMSVDNEHS